DLADTCDSLAELLLDDGQGESAIGYFSESHKALETILTQAADNRPPPQALCDQARNQLNLAKCYLAGDRAAARRHLAQAKDFLDRLGESRGRPDLTEYLMQARYHALLGELDERNRVIEKSSAILQLEQAIKAGYRNRAQLRRDVGFPGWLRNS